MAAATAVGAAAVTASQATAVTITLANDYVSSDGNHLNADLTGDGHPDLTITGAAFYNNHLTMTDRKSSAAVILNGIQARAFSSGYPFFRLQLGSRMLSGYPTASPHSLTGSIPIFFKDLHINGGAPTAGSLEVRLFGAEVQLASLTYTSNTAVQGSRLAVPDQGSSLALLALGAGGVLALRQWRTAQGRS